MDGQEPIIDEQFFDQKALEQQADFISSFVNHEPTAKEQTAQKSETQERNLNLDNKNQEGGQDNLQNKNDDNVSDDFKLEETVADAEAAELKDLNDRLNTNFETLKELNEALGKTSNESESNKEEVEYNQTISLIETLEGYVNANDNRQLLKEKMEVDFKQQGKNPESPEIQEEIELKLDQWEDKETLEFRANTLKDQLRVNLRAQIEKRDNYEKSKRTANEQLETSRKESIKDAVQKLYNETKDGFMGVKVDKQDFIDAYREIDQEKIINSIKKNPELAVEVKLFLKYRKEIAKKAGGATYSDALRDIDAVLTGRQPSKAKNGNVSNNEAMSQVDDSSLIAGFIK